jgi:hypothetical protein
VINVSLAGTVGSNNEEAGVETDYEATRNSAEREIFRKYIKEHYAEQLGTPEKKKRKTFSQFGYGLSFYAFPLFPITDFIVKDEYGEHSYGKPNIKEKNGAIYTCRGGFIDFSHLRAAVDWTVHLAFEIICDGKDMNLQSIDGVMKLNLKKTNGLKLDDVVMVAQKIAFERLVWHELASWYYHLPNYTYSEQQSTFTPEDTYSNFLGTVIGGNIVKRILEKQEAMPFSELAAEEIKKEIASLLPVEGKEQSKEAYDIVDAAKQAKLPETDRNLDVWWDSRVQFRDERNVFKRYISTGPQLAPWLIPRADKVSCDTSVMPEVLTVPQKTNAGNSLYNYYTLTIKPDSLLFFDKKTHEKLHEPFGTFTTQDMQKIIDHVRNDMEIELHPGFTLRDKKNPEDGFKDLKKVLFR